MNLTQFANFFKTLRGYRRQMEYCYRSGYTAVWQA